MNPEDRDKLFADMFHRFTKNGWSASWEISGPMPEDEKERHTRILYVDESIGITEDEYRQLIIAGVLDEEEDDR